MVFPGNIGDEVLGWALRDEEEEYDYDSQAEEIDALRKEHARHTGYHSDCELCQPPDVDDGMDCDDDHGEDR